MRKDCTLFNRAFLACSCTQKWSSEEIRAVLLSKMCSVELHTKKKPRFVIRCRTISRDTIISIDTFKRYSKHFLLAPY